MKKRTNHPERSGDAPLKNIPPPSLPRQTRHSRVQLNVDLGDSDLRDRFKRVCVLRGINMTDRLLQLMEQDVREWYERTGGRVSFSIAHAEPVGQLHFAH